MNKRHGNNSGTSSHTNLLKQAWCSGSGWGAGEEGGLRFGIEVAHGLLGGCVREVILLKLWGEEAIDWWRQVWKLRVGRCGVFVGGVGRERFL